MARNVLQQIIEISWVMSAVEVSTPPASGGRSVHIVPTGCPRQDTFFFLSRHSWVTVHLSPREKYRGIKPLMIYIEIQC
jgi:hypothetical protein